LIPALCAADAREVLMPIEYTVSQSGLRTEAFPSGVLNMHEKMDYFGILKSDPRIAPSAIEIVYFKQVTDINISYLESESIAESYQEPRATRMIIATIFVCQTDLAFGIGRMLQRFTRSPILNTGLWS
jgi:hypothetical protein